MKQKLFFILNTCLAGLLIFCSNISAQKSSKGIYFSHPSGFYDTSFDLNVSIQHTTAELFYTIDGSNPVSSETKINGGTAAIITVDPSIDTNRPTTPAFLVRAIAMIGDSAITEHVSSTYIFLDSVKTQSYPGGDWPFSNVNGQFIDLNVDKKVVENPLYADLIDEALLDIPSISVVTDNDNLFGSSNGIYVNAQYHGKSWERPCSIELINPDGSEGFYENAGLRIRGGWSRHPEFAKHAFRVFFREEYGTDKLRFPLFEDEGVSEFDKIDLRCAQNYAWSNGSGEHNTFVREVFARDSQGEMGHPYTRSRYYHLYLNGMYWGLFQTQERSEARFAESYLGGDKEDYDVVKVDTDYYQYEMEATDGNLDKWNMIWEKTRSSFAPNGAYFSLEGKNSIGKTIPGSEVLVDIDNLIDYMMTVFYTGSFDAPVTQFRGNDFPNNFYAITNRNDKSTGFIFFVHDMEHSLMIEPTHVGKGLTEDRVNIATASGGDKMEITSAMYFNPQWLHYRLSVNKEYQLRFADHAVKLLTNNGIFTEKQALKRFNKRASQIDLAIIGESARWGDTKKSNPYTRDNAWIPELDQVRNEYFPQRPDIVKSQLMRAGLYVNMESPAFYTADTLFDVQKHHLSGVISLKAENPNTEGDILYTLNGEDPRLIGGYINHHAQSINHGNSMDFDASAIIKSRVKNGDQWSALRTITLVSSADDLSALKVTEIHYHPEDHIVGNDTLHSKDLEFIEFKNTSSTALNLSGLQLDSAITYAFPENTILPPGEFYVVASKPSVFYEFYGLHASGNYKSNLSNSGERVVLFDAQNNELIDFTYDDAKPWFTKADGDGPSLAATEFDPTGDPADPAYWRLSVYDGGTPFSDDELITAIDKSIENPWNAAISIYPNPTDGLIQVSVPRLDKDAILHVKLMDLNGQLLLKKDLKNHENIMLAEYQISSGIKVVSVECGEFMQTGKVIIAQ